MRVVERLKQFSLVMPEYNFQGVEIDERLLFSGQLPVYRVKLEKKVEFGLDVVLTTFGFYTIVPLLTQL